MLNIKYAQLIDEQNEVSNKLKVYSKFNGKYVGKAIPLDNGEVAIHFDGETTIRLETIKEIVKFLEKFNKKGA